MTDLWADERSKAEVLPCGIKCLRGEVGPKFTLKMWNPKGKRPFAHYYFESAEKRQAYIDGQVANFESHKVRVSERREARAGDAAGLELVQVGFIFHYSWGYDQTQCEYFQVTEKNGKMVTIREIGSTSIADGTPQPMSEYRIAVKDSFLENSKPLKKRLQFSSGVPYLKMKCGYARPWKGDKNYCSWYA